MTTIRISDEMHLELRKIKGELLARNGKERSFDEIIKFLIDHYKKTKTKERVSLSCRFSTCL